MSTEEHYILFIDKEPLSADLKDYFAKFNIKIVQQKTLYPIHTQHGLPIAILINWAILQSEPEMISNFYQNYPVPLIIINDTPDEETCVLMLESGADDFMTKPLYPRELHARIGAINRRVTRERAQLQQGKNVLYFANWHLYQSSRQVFSESGEELQLSAGEYDLLYAFVQQPQRVLTREFLLQITKHSNLTPFDRRIDIQISRLRQKIETDTKKPALIKTIRNGGYMFTARVVALKESDIK